jgi:hypothetical protein
LGNTGIWAENQIKKLKVHYDNYSGSVNNKEAEQIVNIINIGTMKKSLSFSMILETHQLDAFRPPFP